MLGGNNSRCGVIENLVPVLNQRQLDKQGKLGGLPHEIRSHLQNASSSLNTTVVEGGERDDEYQIKQSVNSNPNLGARSNGNVVSKRTTFHN